MGIAINDFSDRTAKGFQYLLEQVHEEELTQRNSLFNIHLTAARDKESSLQLRDG